MVREVVVGTADSEVEAEIIAGRLRAEEIPVRVRYESQAGVPRQVAPSGLGYGPGGFRVVVPGEHAAVATALLSGIEPRAPGRRPIVRAVSILVLIAFALVWVPGVLGALQAVFSTGR